MRQRKKKSKLNWGMIGRFLFDVCLVGTCLLFFIQDPDGDGDGDGINFAADDPNLQGTDSWLMVLGTPSWPDCG